MYFNALFLDLNSTSACILLTTFCGWPPSSRQNLKFRLFESNPSSIEFVRNQHGVPPFIKPLGLGVGLGLGLEVLDHRHFLQSSP